jgi:hypothetical protein
MKYSLRKAKYKLDFRSPRSDSTRIRERCEACEIMGAAYLGMQQGDVLRRGAPHAVSEVAMTLNALQISAIALGAAALVSSAPLSPASAATVVHHPAHAVHSRVAHGAVHSRVAHGYAHHPVHRYAYRHGHRYAYGYNPGAAVAGAVIGSAVGAAAAYPYGCDPYYSGPWGYGSCPADDWGGYYGPAYGGFGYGYGPGFVGHHRHFGFNNGVGFNGGGPHIAGGNFGHVGGFGGGHVGGFGGGHMGGFGGGHMGGFGGGHFTR